MKGKINNFIAYSAFLHSMFLTLDSLPGDVVKLKFVTEPKDQISVESSVATFHCSAVATPREKLTYLWKLNGEYIDVAKVPRMSISSQGSLQLKPVKTADFGSYECVAMCEEGAIKSQSAKLEKAGIHVDQGSQTPC